MRIIMMVLLAPVEMFVVVYGLACILTHLALISEDVVLKFSW